MRPGRLGKVAPVRGRLFLCLGLLGAAAASLLGAGSVQGRPERYLPPICPGVIFHSEPTLDPQTACMNVGVKTHGTQRGTYLLMTPDGIGAAIFKDNGKLVWWHRSSKQEADFTEVHLWGHPYLAVWDGSGPVVGNNRVIVWRGSILLFDQHYRQVGTITAAGKFAGNNLDQHEFRITRNGDALVDVYHPVKMRINGRSVIVVECVVQKISLVHDSQGIHTGKLLFQWSTQGHIPVSHTYLQGPPSGGAWDYFHLNGITEDRDGNILVSARNTWGVYKVSVKTGHVMWQLGAKGDPETLHPVVLPAQHHRAWRQQIQPVRRRLSRPGLPA